MKATHSHAIILPLVLVTLFVCLIAFKFGVLGYDAGALASDDGYEIQLDFLIDDLTDQRSFTAFLPQSNDRQEITSVQYSGPMMFFTELHEDGIKGVWENPSGQSTSRVTYKFHARIQNVSYDISSDAQISEIAKAISEGTYTSNADLIQPASLSAPAQHLPKNQEFLKAAESVNIHGRLVNGLLLEDVENPIPHTWSELFIEDDWVPFDIQQGHIASLPGTYLSIWTGNDSMLSHAEESAVEYTFSVQKPQISTYAIRKAREAAPEALNPFSIWLSFLDTGMPLVSLKILLLIPLAATIVAFFRNIIGFETYGVFLPALIAVSGLHAGLIPTVGGFLLITLLVALVHSPLERSGLLYVPKLALMLLTVVTLLMSLSYLGLRMGWSEFFSLSLLPLVILAISAEKLSQHLKEEGILKAMQVMGMTLIVITICYVIISAHAVQWLIFSFPEILVLICAANLWMGHWIGLRLTEYKRFRWLAGQTESYHSGMAHVLGINRRNRVVIHQTNNKKHVAIADDKVLTKSILSDYNIPVPQTHLIISEVREIQDKWDHILQLKDFVVKPANGKKGQNILVLSRTHMGWVTPGGRFISAYELRRCIADIVLGGNSKKSRDTAIIEYRIEAHPFLKAIYDQGLPDLRVITHNDEVIQAMLRLPTNESDGKANLHQGALGIGIDIQTGRLMHGLYKDQYVSVHPDSGIHFEGMTLPYWDSILEICQYTSEILPLKYLGIDVVIDEVKGPLILEINARPGLQIQNINAQGLRPLLHQ